MKAEPSPFSSKPVMFETEEVSTFRYFEPVLVKCLARKLQRVYYWALANTFVTVVPTLAWCFLYIPDVVQPNPIVVVCNYSFCFEK